MTTHDRSNEQLDRFVPKDRPVTFADLRALFVADPDLMYKLAVEGVSEDAPIAVKGLERLARVTSVLARDGFSVASRAQQHYAMGNRGGYVALDQGQDDIQFLEELYAGQQYPTKFSSRKRSRECLQFFLEEHAWDSSVRSSVLLSVAPEDADAILGGMPRYQYDSLLDSAREVVQCPAAVYKGLRPTGSMESDGWAFCGVPSRRWLNSGTSVAPSPGFTFVVFADPEGYVFDWDWVPASSENPSIPRDCDARFPFSAMTGLTGSLLVGNVARRELKPFLPRRAWFSARGDCVFWYFDDVETYAGRYDDYLTVFFRIDGNIHECVGFKLKMISTLMKTVSQWASGASDRIEVEFDRDTIRVDLKFLMNAWIAAKLPLTAELFPGMKLMEQLGRATKELQIGSCTLNIPRKALHELQQA